jgi:hypothetical protein
MQIYIARDGKSHGPYSLDDIKSHLASGSVFAHDLAWYDGCSAWVPLSQVEALRVAPGSGQTLPPPPPPTSSLPPAPPSVPFSAPQAAPGHPTAPTAMVNRVAPPYVAGSSAHSQPHDHQQDLSGGERTIFSITPSLNQDIPLSILTCGFWVLFLPLRWLVMQACRYRLTTQRLFVTKGLIARHVEEVELYRVKDVTVNQGTAGRMFGYGDVVVHVSDATTKSIVLSGVADPMAIKEKIREQVRAARKAEGIQSVEHFQSS